VVFWGPYTDISAIHGPIVDILKFFNFVLCLIIENITHSMPYLFSSKIRIYELKFFKLQQFQYFAMIFN